MAKNGCSEFFLTIFPKKTGIIQKKWLFQIFPTIFPKKTGIIQNGQKWLFQFFPTIFPKKTSINLKWPKIESNESNEKFFEKKLSGKTFLSKQFYERNKFGQKKISGNFLKFLSSDIFQRSCEKQCFLHLEHM